MNQENTAKFETNGEIKNLFTAIYQAKKRLGSTISPQGNNPFYSSTYITLDSLIKKIDPIMLEQQLQIIQMPTGFGLCTLLFHEPSSEYLSFYYELILEKKTPQGVGSALTYAKRQIYQALFGLSAGEDEDDDGNKAETAKSANDDQADINRIVAKATKVKSDNSSGRLNPDNALKIARVALQEIHTLSDLDIYWSNTPSTVRSNQKIIDLFKTKGTELKMTV